MFPIPFISFCRLRCTFQIHFLNIAWQRVVSCIFLYNFEREIGARLDKIDAYTHALYFTAVLFEIFEEARIVTWLYG